MTTTTAPLTTTTEHERLARQLDEQANAVYDLAETTHDRKAAWAFRMQAEQLVVSASEHYAAAGL